MKPTLPTNYKDDILNTSVEGMRRYQMIYNSDNTVSFKDVTPYDQTGSYFGACDINATTQAVNQSADAGKIIDDPDTAAATTKEGYIAGVQLFNHVSDSLIGFPDYENVITYITTANASYTATQKGWLIGTVRQSESGNGAYVLVNDKQVAGGLFAYSESTYYPLIKVFIPIDKGDIITTHTKGIYSLQLYGMK